jgi:hypothetical protein
MANPTGRTQHVSQGRSAEGRDPRFTYRDHPLPPEYSIGRMQPPVQTAPQMQRTWLETIASELGTIAQRYPLLSVCASVTAGYVAARLISRVI